VYRAAPTIDAMMVQFYNQGPTCYGTYGGIFTQSGAPGECDWAPGTSIQEIASYGIPLNKIVLGKYLLTADADNGYLTAAKINAMIVRAQTQMNWNAGVMCWEYQQATSKAWISTIYPTVAAGDQAQMGFFEFTGNANISDMENLSGEALDIDSLELQQGYADTDGTTDGTIDTPTVVSTASSTGVALTDGHSKNAATAASGSVVMVSLLCAIVSVALGTLNA